MNLAYTWLQDYVKTNLSPAELGERFLLTSSVVDDITDWSTKFSGLVTGKVLAVTLHPNADRLRIAQVEVGNTTRTIVCGAPNLAVGQIVVVALPGTTVQSLKGGTITIAESEIRGVTSEGMLCAASEIGLPLIHEDGILVLDPATATDLPLAHALPIGDAVLDLEITPNRPDLLSYVGLAREVATFEKKSLVMPPLYVSEENAQLPQPPIHVDLQIPQLCQRYSAIALDSVEIKPSPLWMQCRLILAGIRPINTVVDITNYVMLEYGLPLHAFDLDCLLSAGGITMRIAKAGETLSTLDRTQRTLNAGDIVLSTEKEGPVDLVGIMGGFSSSITPSTTRLYLHAVVVHGPSVRRTSRALGLRTEASSRYEKGLDPELTIPALKRAVYLLQNLAHAEVSSEFLDIHPKVRGIHAERPRIHVSFARIQQVLGVHISAPEAKTILQKLGFQLPVLTKSSFEAVPPSWRKDITLAEDVIEEIVRIWGFDRLPATLPVGPVKAPEPNMAYHSKKTIRHTLAALGMHETIHQSFASEAGLRKIQWPAETAVSLPEPRLSEETAYLLPTHLLPFLSNISGVNRNFPEIFLFEIGSIFSPSSEEETLSLMWRSDGDLESLYRTAKTHVAALMSALSFSTIGLFTPQADGPHYLEKGTVLQLGMGGQMLGTMGVVKKDLVHAFKLRNGKAVVFATISLKKIFGLTSTHRLYQPVSAFPSIERDLSVTIPKENPVQLLLDRIEASRGPILSSYAVTTIYRGKPLADTEKSVTVHFTYGDFSRTLSDAEVNEDQLRIRTLLNI
jgi:phenylalanyl-tRNA synthetase beta chain